MYGTGEPMWKANVDENPHMLTTSQILAEVSASLATVPLTSTIKNPLSDTSEECSNDDVNVVDDKL